MTADDETRHAAEFAARLRCSKTACHAQKLTALGELVSTTTHEFNNVLMTILNYARMGLRHKDEATRDKALEKILAAAQRAPKSPAASWPSPAIAPATSSRRT